jgi:uncharacterized protein YbjT (DUF2867 family)
VFEEKIMIVVTTPTGNIGSEVVKHLLDAGEAVRVIVRDPAKLAPEVREKVTVVQGSMEDEAVLSRAFEGAESLFWLVPPSFQDKGDIEYYLRFTRPACRAIQSQGVKRVVAVSGLGRGIPADAGPATAAFAMEAEIEKTGVDFRALWCPGFMENMLTQAEPLKHQGMFFATYPADFKTRFAATRDIAASAANLLLDKSWTGQGGLAVLGPEDLSHNDMAAIMTEVLGKPIRYQQIPGEALKAQLVQHGANEVLAQGLVNMFAAKVNGLDNAEPRTAENTTPTSFRQWCEEVLKPAILS